LQASPFDLYEPLPRTVSLSGRVSPGARGELFDLATTAYIARP
jgi:hypothetical protein